MKIVGGLLAGAAAFGCVACPYLWIRGGFVLLLYVIARVQEAER